MLPSSLSENVRPELFNPYTKDIIESTEIFIVEKTKTARRFMKAIFKEKDIDNCIFHELNKHTEEYELETFLAGAMQGKNIALLSEAGCPGIADPGAKIVRIAHQKNIRIVPVPGPSSIYMALMASGFNGQHFEFHGYLDKDQSKRKKQIQHLESTAQRMSSSQIFMETPFRNKHLFEDLINVCNKNSLLCIARNISEPEEYIQTKTIGDWEKTKIDLNKRPCIFILGS